MFQENPAESILRILAQRRSIRKFKEDRLDSSLLMRLIEYAVMAPSATNKQAWRFIIVEDPKLKNEMVKGGGSALIDQAPCGILVTYSNQTRNLYYSDHIQSAGACIQNLLLAAHAHGLGACWVCNLPSKRFLAKLFNIPSDFTSVAYVILGYPREAQAKPVPRKNPISAIVSLNKFPTKGGLDISPKHMLRLERFLVWIYRISPVSIKSLIFNKMIDEKFTKKFDN